MTVEQRIHNYIWQRKSEIVDILKALIKIPSVKGEAKENAPFGEACAEALSYTQKLYESYGFATEADAEGGYLLSFFGEGKKSLGLFAHADVVPVSDDWILTKPFEPLEKDGYIIGRGAIDDKSAIVVSLFCARMLKELKLTYNVYDEKGTFDTDNLKLLIVGENADFDDDFKSRLRNYIKNGGKVIFTGSAIDLGKEIGALDFVELVENDTRDNAYYTIPESSLRTAMYDPARIVKNISGKEIARYVDNVFNFIWDGRQSYKYRPQGEITDYSAAVVGKNTACICFDIFQAYADNLLIDHRMLLEKAIDELMPERLIVSERMPKTATVAITKTAQHTVFHVKSTYAEHKISRGIIEEHNYMKSVPVSIASKYKEVYILPEMTRVESKIEEGRTLFETGDILGYRAFLLKE